MSWRDCDRLQHVVPLDEVEMLRCRGGGGSLADVPFQLIWGEPWVPAPPLPEPPTLPTFPV